ncbi:acetyltransferase [candidate division TM6 bacterium RIFCSPHIGHO2_12_FULL_36_22]|nr:MAG: acetyltransferase [candidate division TM6 bacterium RIFCSPHIGHO2_12_FULL_36_22]
MTLEITLSLVKNLITEQFPQWAHLPIKPVEVSGWDNRTFYLGTEMSIRLPSAQCYAAKVQIEQKWLPILAPHLSFRIPKPLAMGQPSKNYHFNWSIYRWIEGKNANILTIDESHLKHIALQLAQFLNELHKIDPTDGPLAGPHNFYRGGSLQVYDSETRSALSQLQDFINVEAAKSVWKKALSSRWDKSPVWIHGDLSAGNILIKDNQLTAVIDFGGMGIGDPACDLVIAWTFLKNESRKAFKTCVDLDSETWARARGWALWKALITLVPLKNKTNLEALKQKNIIEEIISET